MLTRTLLYIYKHLLTILCLLAVVSCTDDLAIDQSGTENPLNQDKGIGELVLFSSGNTGNSSTRAVIPYMEQEGRFVCKMYYHAKATDTDASPFDTVSTPITSWLRVNNNEGNSVYWKNDFDMSGVDTNHQDYKDYGFDSRAQYFYWRNRLDHVFLAYTDFNKLKTNIYGKNQGQLFMYPESDGAKKTKTGTRKTYKNVGYKQLVFGIVPIPNPDYDADEKRNRDEAIAQWEQDKAAWEEEHPGESCPEAYTVPETIDVFGVKEVNPDANYPVYSGSMFPLSTNADSYLDNSKETIVATRNKVLSYVDASTILTQAEKTVLKDDLDRLGESEEVNTAEGTFRYDRWWLYFNPDADNAFDNDGAVNLAAPGVYLGCAYQKQEIEDIIATAPANVFDLKRKPGMNSMADQPDPLIALTKMKPLGATQEANRVRLYFKHQFSQIQVNLTKGENTPDIKKENILSVELLGVTEKGYVFTNINPDGTQIPPTYDPVVKNKYTPEQLKENEHGTSFSMFVMDENAKPLSSLKSFNAIAFGQLQAIRITWKEDDYVEDGTTYEGVKHVASYAITVDDRGHSLKNLQSGYRYVYDFELRRGTIAFIRAIIDGWRLVDELNHGTDGFIDNSTQTN